jgi:glycosyltransferase involved in cell wall biosynthesis
MESRSRFVMGVSKVKILIYHPVPLPVSHYGGTERVVMWLARNLAKRGHAVTLFAAPGSSLPEPLRCWTDPEQLLSRVNEFDVVHSFTKLPEAWDERTRGRILFTIQGNGQRGERFHRNTVFVSRNHAERHGATAFVYNGLDPEELRFDAGPRPNRYLFLSKTSLKTKNLRGAARVCARMHQNLWIAGGERPYGIRVQAAVRRCLGQDWKWVGSVDQEQKARFLLQGKAMVFPLLWNEPFGLVVTESLVSGTPVLAHPHGSLSELLEFAPQCLMRSEQDWERALSGDFSLPSPKDCRDWVLSRFEHQRMTQEYLGIYERVISGEKLNAEEPVTRTLAEEIG